MKKYLYSTILLLSFFLAGVSFAQIPVPTQLAPPNGDTTVSLTVTMDWTDVSGATGYQLQVYRISDGVKILDTIVVQSNDPIPAGLFTVNTWYSWRVRTIAGSQQSNWTGYWTFRTVALAPPNPPQLIQPSNGAINQPLILTFRWSKVQGATYYHLQVSTNAGFTSFAIDANGLTDTQYISTTGQLQNNFTYYWRVNANNQGGSSPWSTVWYFSTQVAPPPPPVLQSPPNGSQNQSLTPTLTWTPAPGATYYHVRIESDTVSHTIAWEANNVSGTSIVVPPNVLWGLQWFYWKVASGNTAGEGVWSGYFRFRTLPGPPPAPTLLNPPDSTQNISRFPTLYWNCLSPAPTSYRIQISTDPTFQTNLLINAVVAGTICQYTVTSNVLLNNTWYCWRVNATNTIGGTGPWSDVWHFKTVPLPPSPPTLLLPPNHNNPTPLNPLFKWLAGAGAEQYQIQVSANAGFTQIVLNYTTPDTATQYQMQLGILVGGHTYYWRVRSINGNGTQQSSYTPTWDFMTQVTQTANLTVFLEGFYNGTDQVRDTIKVYLANATSPHAFQDSMTVYLASNGSGGVSFLNAPNGNYYIVVRHRNHLETWSSSAVSFALGNPVNYDFTTGSNKAFCNNMKQVGSAWVFYGGDANQDGNIDVGDYNLSITQFGTDGYLNCDFNGDNFADGYDLLILYSNYFHSMCKPPQ